MATLQVRSIDDGLYKALGRRASMDNRSISQEVVSILKEHLASPKSHRERSTSEFLAMCGSWEDERDPDTIIMELRKSRRNRDGSQVFF